MWDLGMLFGWYLHGKQNFRGGVKCCEIFEVAYYPLLVIYYNLHFLRTPTCQPNTFFYLVCMYLVEKARYEQNRTLCWKHLCWNCSHKFYSHFIKDYLNFLLKFVYTNKWKYILVYIVVYIIKIMDKQIIKIHRGVHNILFILGW